MFQCINECLRRNIVPEHILYFSFDKKIELDELIYEYLKISNADLQADTLYFFLDEIQKLDDWQNKIKHYYDLYPNIKFILSGSSSLFLKSEESLAGRLESTTIKPLFFEEFLRFKNLEYLLEKPLLYQPKLVLEFEKYLYRQFYDTIEMSLFEAKKYTENLKNKIIKQDAQNYFHIKHTDILLQLFEIIRANPGMILDYKNLANDLDLDPRTIQTYIFYLEESFLVQKVYNFSKNMISSEKKQKKIYLNGTVFFAGNGEITGELFENYIQNTLDLKYFYKLGKREVDFVQVHQNKEIEAIEVKYKSTIKKEYAKHLNFFADKFKTYKKTIITKSNSENFDDIEVKSFWEV